jgi:DNA-directed RNA polymerase subunit RPC12/RpoP
MSSKIVRYFSCIYCGSEYSVVESDNIYSKVNKYKINRDDIETIYKCKECGKINKLYWSQQKRSK